MSTEEPDGNKKTTDIIREQGAFKPALSNSRAMQNVPPHTIDKVKYILKNEALLNHVADYFERAAESLKKAGPSYAKDIVSDMGMDATPGELEQNMQYIQTTLEKYAQSIDALIIAAKRAHHHETKPLTGEQYTAVGHFNLNDIARDLDTLARSTTLFHIPEFGHAMAAEATELCGKVGGLYKESPGELNALNEYSGIGMTASISHAMDNIVAHRLNPELRGPARSAQAARQQQAERPEGQLRHNAHRTRDKGNTIEQVSERVGGLTAKNIRQRINDKTEAQEATWVKQAIGKHGAVSETFETRMMQRRDNKAEAERQ